MEGNKVVKAILDTTVLIHLLKNKSDAISAVEKLRLEGVVLYTASINIYEYLKGAEMLEKEAKERESPALGSLIRNINVLNIDVPSSQKAAELYAQLRKKSITLDECDYLIAGAALSNGIFIIVTQNEKHFKHIKEFEKVITY